MIEMTTGQWAVRLLVVALMSGLLGYFIGYSYAKAVWAVTRPGLRKMADAYYRAGREGVPAPRLPLLGDEP